MLTIFVVGFDPVYSGCVGGCEWRTTEAAARDYYNRHIVEFPTDDVRLFALDVEDGDNKTEAADDAAHSGYGVTLASHTAVKPD